MNSFSKAPPSPLFIHFLELPWSHFSLERWNFSYSTLSHTSAMVQTSSEVEKGWRGAKNDGGGGQLVEREFFPPSWIRDL